MERLLGTGDQPREEAWEDGMKSPLQRSVLTGPVLKEIEKDGSMWNQKEGKNNVRSDLEQYGKDSRDMNSMARHEGDSHTHNETSKSVTSSDGERLGSVKFL